MNQSDFKKGDQVWYLNESASAKYRAAIRGEVLGLTEHKVRVKLTNAKGISAIKDVKAETLTMMEDEC
jgi:hypothetical protein